MKHLIDISNEIVDKEVSNTIVLAICDNVIERLEGELYIYHADLTNISPGVRMHNAIVTAEITYWKEQRALIVKE
jgi:hypothetical protein